MIPGFDTWFLFSAGVFYIYNQYKSHLQRISDELKKIFYYKIKGNNVKYCPNIIINISLYVFSDIIFGLKKNHCIVLLDVCVYSFKRADKIRHALWHHNTHSFELTTDHINSTKLMSIFRWTLIRTVFCTVLLTDNNVHTLVAVEFFKLISQVRATASGFTASESLQKQQTSPLMY